MIRTGLPITKPAIAAAVPVNEFRRQITTGMSAPPIGRTIVIPKTEPASDDDGQDASVARRQVDGAGRAEDEADRPERPRATARANVTIRAAGDHDRLAGDQALELAAGDQRAGERDRRR